jgi:carboxypeptidase family protein
MAYGGKRPNGYGLSDQGQPVQLGEGQSFDKVVISLPRGGVITGRVTDENGEPLTRVQVYSLFFPPGSSRGVRMGPGSQTDDLGQFRIYGLQPGDHVVVAEGMRNTFVPPNAPPETEEDKIGFITTYYPGTPDEGTAQRVRARAGTETPGIEIRLLQDRLYRVSGSVVDSQGQPLPHVNGQVMRRTPGMTGGSSYGFNTDEKGQFQMRNVASGNYRLIVRQTRPFAPGPGPQADPGEMASLPLTIAGADLDNVIVMTTPGVTITGQVVFEQGPPSPIPGMPGPLRVMAMVGNPEEMSGLQPPQPAVVKPDLTFTMKGLLGELLLRASAPSQYLKSVTVGSQDITDKPREFKANDRITITLTSRVSTVEGNVSDAAGAPMTDAGIILFSEEKATWRYSSARTKRSPVDPYAHFRITGLMPGRYLIVAVPRDRFNVPNFGDANSALFEELSKVATALVIGEDEERKVDLKVVTGSGGQ